MAEYAIWRVTVRRPADDCIVYECMVAYGDIGALSAIRTMLTSHHYHWMGDADHLIVEARRADKPGDNPVATPPRSDS